MATTQQILESIKRKAKELPVIKDRGFDIVDSGGEFCICPKCNNFGKWIEVQAGKLLIAHRAIKRSIKRQGYMPAEEMLVYEDVCNLTIKEMPTNYPGA